MKLIIKNKLVSLRGNSIIKDEQGNNKYKVKGKLFSITHKKRIYDLDNKLLFTVRNKYWKFIVNSAYIFDSEGNKIARLKQLWGFKSRYEFIGYEDDIKVEGNWIGWNLSIKRNGVEIGTIQRNIDWVDSFVLSCDEIDAPLLVAIVIAIDNIQDKNIADND